MVCLSIRYALKKRSSPVSAISLLGNKYTKSWAAAEIAEYANRIAGSKRCSFMLLEDFGQLGFQVFGLESAGNDYAIGIDQQVVGYGAD